MDRTYQANDDTPLRSSDDDKLGFRPFAERMAKALASIDAREGYVVGMHGVWGSGKSTVLNFVISEIERLNAQLSENEKVAVVRFEPWLVSGHQDLIASFFKVLAEHLPALVPQPTTKFQRFRKAGTRAGGPLIDAAAALGTAIDPTGGIGVGAIAAIAKSTLQDRIKRWNETPSLQRAFQDLVQKLQEHRRRIVVVIDDVDRLTPHEIREMMQLVKSVGRLPHIIYLLAYDRRIVWAALQESGQPDDGPSFAEKIIQHELELPRPQQHGLFEILDAASPEPISAMRSDDRFHRIVRKGLENWIITPRDAIRLGNALNFAWSALKDEIDPQDLIAIEGLRLFDYEAFSWVRTNRTFFVDQLAFLSDDDKKSFAEKMREKLHLEDDSYILDILCILFPGREKYMRRGRQYSSEPHYAMVARGGIGYDQGYDTYFGLYPPDGEISKSTTDMLVSRLDDQEYIEKAIDDVFGRNDRKGEPMVGALLQALQYRLVASDELTPTKELLRALLKKGDQIVAMKWTGRYLLGPPHTTLSGLFRVMVRRWGQEKALDEFRCAVADCSPLMASFLLIRLSPELAKQGADSRELLTDDQASKLTAAVEKQIRAALENGTLREAPDLWTILAAWERFAPAVEIKGWIAETLEANPAVLGRLPVFGQRHSDSTVTCIFMSDSPEELYDKAVLAGAAEKILSDSSSPDDLREKAEAVLVVLKGDESGEEYAA